MVTPERLDALEAIANARVAAPLSAAVAITGGELLWLVERARATQPGHIAPAPARAAAAPTP